MALPDDVLTPDTREMGSLWLNGSDSVWRAALDSYRVIVERQGVAALGELDLWYREDLPEAIARRRPRYATLAELTKLTQWKMARGVWRAPNLVLVKGNDPEGVKETTQRAIASAPHPTSPIAALAKLDGVGPATASALMAAAEPSVYPFFDELVAAKVPQLGAVKWTLGYYAKYADALRERARSLGGDWTPVMVERAVWSSVGGKAGDAALRGTR